MPLSRATLITGNLSFDEWTETLGPERLTGALLDRITHHVSIFAMNGDSIGSPKAAPETPSKIAGFTPLQVAWFYSAA